MNRITLLLALTLMAALNVKARPNLVLLVAEELGYGDLSCYRGAAPTPHLDALAASGTRVLRYYTAASASRPARAGLLTGWYPARLGLADDTTDPAWHLPTNTLCLPRLLREAGYTTAHVGCWHLGGFTAGASAPGPREHGFDHWFGREENNTSGRGTPRWLRDGRPVETAADSPLMAQRDEALQMLDRLAAAAKPFFLNVWFESAAGPAGETVSAARQRHRAAVAELDAAVGQILARLETLGISSNTLVVFTGATGPGPGGDTRNFRGEAGTLLEGGLRVPFLIRWSGVIRAGRSVSPVLHTTDVLPTLCAAAGVRLAPEQGTDGINFLDYLKGGVPAPLRPVVVWRQTPDTAAYERQGVAAPHPDEAVLFERWKVFFAAGRPVAVFNVYTDPAERFDRLRDPKEARALEKVPPLLEQWRAAMGLPAR